MRFVAPAVAALVAVCSCTRAPEEMAEEMDGAIEDPCPELAYTEAAYLRVNSAEDAAALPRYTVIEGTFRVEDAAGLEDLSFLECLREVDGDFFIQSNPDLLDLAGLEALEFVDALAINDNPQLAKLTGLDALESVGSLYLEDNPVLASLEGISQLASADWISILRNDNLRTIGLRTLRTVGTIQVGYGQCLAAGEEPVPQGNAGLIELDGLEALEQYDVLRMSGNPNLVSIEGLIPALEGSEGPIFEVELNSSLPYGQIEVVEDALGTTLQTCGNLDEPEVCVCAAPD